MGSLKLQSFEDFANASAEATKMKLEEEQKATKYVESELPQEKQKNKGWYWDYNTKKFYRWDNLPRS